MPQSGYHFTVGKFKCAVYSDGILKGEEPESEEVFGLNCLLIDSGREKLLIDTGCGDNFQSGTGKLMAGMAADGIKGHDIDKILLTHGHIDHAAGCFGKNGRCFFPRARFIAHAREWEYWEKGAGKNEKQDFFFRDARMNLLPIRQRFDLVEDNAEIMPGVRLIPAHGHTPGNVMVEISSAGERLLCVGDIIHSQQEFIQPDCMAAFDVSPSAALATRKKLLALIADEGVLVFACHFQFPGLGHIVREKGTLAWKPI